MCVAISRENSQGKIGDTMNFPDMLTRVCGGAAPLGVFQEDRARREGRAAGSSISGPCRLEMDIVPAFLLGQPHSARQSALAGRLLVTIEGIDGGRAHQERNGETGQATSNGADYTAYNQVDQDSAEQPPARSPLPAVQENDGGGDRRHEQKGDQELGKGKRHRLGIRAPAPLGQRVGALLDARRRSGLLRRCAPRNDEGLEKPHPRLGALLL